MKFKKLLLLLPTVVITSCGYSLSYLVEGNKYNSPIFNENYYSDWNVELKNAEEEKNVTLGSDQFITSFNQIDKLDQGQHYDSIDDYSKKNKMNNINEMFNYGYQSKLFDGIYECDGIGFQLLRIQSDAEGFSVRFSKESSELRYIALQFKSTTNNQRACLKIGDTDPGDIIIHNDVDLFHSSTLDLVTSIYYKNEDNEIVKNVYKATVTNPNTNNGSKYIFFGFDLREEKLSRVVGYSITYENLQDDLINWNIDNGGPTDIEYALFLYELFMPYTSWN